MLFARQSRFSLVSALFAVTLMLVMIADAIIGHEFIERRVIAIGIAFYFCFTVIPLVLGRRYPWWMGLCFVAGISGWSILSLQLLRHAHVEMNAILEAPIVAVYLGWFFVQWLARVALSIYLSIMAVGTTLLPRIVTHEFSSSLAIMYAVLIAWFCLESGMYLRRRVTLESHTDSLTGALNRRGLNAQGRLVIARARRRGEALTVAAIDFDDFKGLNDSHGHAAGDDALSSSVELWRSTLESRDLIARVGGDEFILLIHRDIGAVGELLTEASASAPYRWSWGLSAVDPAAPLAQALERADGELYRAKARR